MAIETLGDWNAILACCCAMPSCPLPLTECESVSASAVSRGYTNDADEEWTLYKRYGTRRTISGSHTYSESISYYGLTSSSENSIEATQFNGYEWDHPYEIGGANEFGCAYSPATESVNCSASGSSTQIESIRYYWGEPDGEGHFASAFAPQWMCVLAITGGGAYPCSYEFTNTLTIYPHYFGYNSDGSSPDPGTNDATVQAWADGGFIGDAPCSGTAVVVGETSSIGDLIPSFFSSGDYTDTSETTYEDGMSLTEWTDDAREALDGLLTFEGTAPECKSDLCQSTDSGGYLIFTVAWLDITKARVRDLAPVEHLGTYFKVTYDIYDYDADSNPTLVSADNVNEWEGPGTGDQDDPSWIIGDWIELGLPTPPNILRKRMNFRYECYRSPWGSKPQLSGEGQDLPE